MDFIQDVRSTVKPCEIRTASTGTRYSFNIHQVTEDHDGQQITMWSCDQYWFPVGEYNMIQNGIMVEGVQWTAELHKIFREYQHTRADDLYVYAQRMLRTTSDTKYSDYITALDQWNAQVSALAGTMSLDVPDIPTL